MSYSGFYGSEPEFAGLQPIQNKFLQGNYLQALQFKEGFVFIRVIARQIIQFKPYNVITTGGAAVYLAPQTGSGDIQLRDPNSLQNSVLFVPQNLPFQLLHVGIGIRPIQIKAFIRYPDASTVMGGWPNLNAVNPSASPNYEYGYFSSVESPYESPTDYTEMFIPVNTQIGFEFWNSEPIAGGAGGLPGNSYQPALNILAANYSIQVLNPTQQPDQTLIWKIATRAVPAAYNIVGAFLSPLSYQLDSTWLVSPISLQQAINLPHGSG